MIRALLFVLALLPAAGWAQTANLWIDTDGGTCTRQGTPATYVDAAACSSMDAAINACTAGDTIRMKAGTYGAQSINRTKTTPGCTIVAETTTTLTGGLKTHGAWYEIQNIVGTGWDIDNTTGGPGTNNITCRDCHFSGNSGVWWVANGYSDISWIGGSLTNFEAGSGISQAFAIWSGEVAGGSTTAENILVEGVTFDDITNPLGGVANHFEAIRVDGIVDGLTLDRIKLTNIEAHSSTIFFTNFRGSSPTNVLIRNTVCENSVNVCADANFQSSGAFANFTFSHNTFKVAPWGTAEATSISNFVWVGNIGPRNSGQCNEGTSYTDNVWHGSAGSGCDASDLTTSDASMNFDADGFHILSGSAAIGAGGTGVNCIASDIDGNSRSDPCDAGAHEFGASGGGSAPDAPTNVRFTKLWPPGNFRLVRLDGPRGTR